MEENILNKNLKYIRNYNENLAKNIANLTDLQGSYEIKEAKSGDSILYKNGIPMDNDVDPVWDAIEKNNKVPDKSHKDILIIYGMGVGYNLKEFAKKFPGRIIVYEPDIEVLRIVFEIIDFSEELKQESIAVACSYEDLETAYYRVFFTNYNLKFVFSTYYLDQHHEELNRFKSKIEDTHSIFQSNFRNAAWKSSRWTYELMNNIEPIVNNQDLHKLKNRFKGKTAVIISAGPSLDKNIEDLKPYRDKVIVFCVGTALKTAVKHQIIPDFAVVIETSPASEKQLNIPELSYTNLIVGSNSYHKIYDLKPKRFFNYHSNKTPAAKYFGYILEVPVEMYEVAGTVSITSLYSAKMLGCDKIIMIGQDLAYTDNKCYSSSSIYGNYKLGDEKTVSYEEDPNSQKNLDWHKDRIADNAARLSKELCTIKGINGETLVTRPDFLLFNKYFEEIARLYGSELKLINATEHGAYIEGFEHLTFKEALEKYSDETTVEVESVLKENKIGAKEIKKRYKLVQNSIYECVKKYNLVKNIIADSVNLSLSAIFDEEELANYRELKNNFELGYEKSRSLYLSEEEKSFADAYKQRYENFKKSIQENSLKLFENDLERLQSCLNLLKPNYLKIEKIIGEDFLLKNIVMGNIMNANDAFKIQIPRNNNPKKYLVLFKRLSMAFVSMDLFYPIVIDKVKKLCS